MRWLEPSFGNGDFLLPAIDRLLMAWKASGETEQPVQALGACIHAVELHRDTFDRTRAAVLERLLDADIPEGAAGALADRWLVQGDFLPVTLPEPFGIVVGNPPNVRQELIPDALLAEYRSRYGTIYDRADLYYSVHRTLARGPCQGRCARLHLCRPLDEEPLWRAVATYSTRMRGGYMRFQARYPRRTRVPYWQDVPMRLRSDLMKAAATRDAVACNRAVFELHGLSEADRPALIGNDE